MPAGLQPPDPPLSDGVVTLRVPDERRDAPSLRHFEDPEIVRCLLGGPPQPPNPDAMFSQQLQWWRDGTNAVFSIDAAGHEERVGVTRVMLGLVDPFGFAEIGYFLFPHGRGQGYATRTVRLVADWVLGELGIGRLQARTSAGNVASERSLSGPGSGARGSRAPASSCP